MNPFKEFNHFIAFFIPGTILFAIFASLISITTNINYLIPLFRSPANLFITLIGGTISGLFLDELRHVLLEERFEKIWAKKRNVDIGQMVDFVNYSRTIGIDLYKLIRDEYFYYYEFDINISISLFLGLCLFPFYLSQFHLLPQHAILIFEILLLVISIAFWNFGKNAYEYFLDVLKEETDRKDQEGR